MMKINNKGFTLIESIVAIAIITIASGMFILGFINVTTLMRESSIIKTETNRLFEQISIDGDEVIKNQSGTMILNGMNCQVDIHSIISHEDDMEIRLSRFVSDGNGQLSMLPDNIGEGSGDNEGGGSDHPVEKLNYSAYYKFLIDYRYFPKNLSEVTEMSGKFVDDYNPTEVVNAIKKDYPKDYYSATGDIARYVVNIPSQAQMNEILPKLNDVYKNELNNNYEYFWFAVKTNSGIDYPTIFGMLLPKDCNVVYFMDDQKNYQKISFVNRNTKTMEDDQIADNSKSYECNGVSYSKESLKRCEFFKDDQKIYFINFKYTYQ